MSVSVLVVEDDPVIRHAIAALLERERYEVHGAASAEEALDLLARLPRPCILLWDPLSPRPELELLGQAALEGVHVATLPVSMASDRRSGASPARLIKRLLSVDAILSIVREHCPLDDAANS
jgi:CheY-like chemotaxis protein